MKSFGFFQVRYGSNPGTPRPRGKVEFTIGSRWGDVTKYMYVSITNSHGHAVLDWDAALSVAVALTEQELRDLFGGDLTITKDKLQREEILKIHRQMFLIPGLLHYGVVLLDGDVVLDKDGQAIEDRPLEDYQNGKTIVYPVAYAARQPTRLFFNLSTPAVEEYAIQYSLHTQAKNADRALFFDNMMTNERLYYDEGKPLHYVHDGSGATQMVVRARHIIGILKQVRSRIDPIAPPNHPRGWLNNGIILNTFRDRTLSAAIFRDEIIKPGNRDCFDMLMSENYFWEDGRCTNVELYLEWVKKLGAEGKSLIFAISGDQFRKHSLIVTSIWLWLHLVCDGSNFVYLNDRYSGRMIKYPAYKLKLGRPLEEPRKVVDTWYRRFKRGTIIFDTSSGQIGAIRFEKAGVLARVFQSRAKG